MATNTTSLHSPIPKPHHSPHSLSFLKPTSLSLPPSKPLSLSLSSTSSPSSLTSLDSLRSLLASSNFRSADDETRRLLIALAGDSALARGYIFFSEVQYIPTQDLLAIDELWRQASGGKFGYSVQKKIFNGRAERDFTRFFIRVGWMKKLDTEVEQYNYRSFPTEFVWEIGDETPDGHLPLTNALRGTQLLNSIFNHPAFDGVGEGDGIGVSEDKGEVGSKGILRKNGALPSTDYSF